MALKFNTSAMHGEALLTKLGVDPDLIAKVLAEGWTIGITMGTVKLKNGGKETAYKVDMGLLAKVKAGTLTPTDVMKAGVVKSHLTAHLKACVQEGPEPVLFDENGAPPPQVSNLTPVSKTIPLLLEGAFPVSEMKSAPTVPLASATKLYQPVKGSNTGSRYFVVGLNAHVRVAARYQGGSLSVRVEGPDWTSHKSVIDDVGLDLSSKGTHASAHMPIADHVLAAKTLGCILAGLCVKGLQFETPIPSFSVIAGAA